MLRFRGSERLEKHACALHSCMYVYMYVYGEQRIARALEEIDAPRMIMRAAIHLSPRRLLRALYGCCDVRNMQGGRIFAPRSRREPRDDRCRVRYVMPRCGAECVFFRGKTR